MRQQHSGAATQHATRIPYIGLYKCRVPLYAIGMQRLSRLILSLLCLVSMLPLAAAEGNMDLSLDTIDRTMQREAQRNAKVASYIDIQKKDADAKLDDLEKRYQELKVAVYYQDYSNFFYLTYYCHRIAELRAECFSGNFPFTQTKLRMEMAVQRYAYLSQALDSFKPELLNEDDRAKLERSRAACSELAEAYRAMILGLEEEQKRFEQLTDSIRRLDLYANGKNVEMYTMRHADHGVVNVRKLMEFTAARKAEKEQAAAAAVEKKDAEEERRAKWLAEVTEEGLAYGTDVDIHSDMKLEDEEKSEGRLASRIAMALWDPSHPFRKLDASSVGFLTRWAYVGIAFHNNYIDAYDREFAQGLGRLGLWFLGFLFIATLTGITIDRLLRRRRDINRVRLRHAMLALGFLLIGAALGLYSLTESKDLLAEHTRFLAEFMVLSAVLFGSLIIRLSSRRINCGVKLYLPLFILNLLLIAYCVMMCTSFLITMTAPPVFLICGVWMLIRFLRRMGQLRISARVFAVLSIILMFAGAAVCQAGYYYLMILISLSWYVLVTNVMLMTAISKISKLICRRISANNKLRGYRHYLCVWVRLVVSQMVQPMVFLGLIWYGLRWPAEGLDLGQFFASWMGTPLRMEGAIRSITADDIVLILTVGIILNCAIAIIKETINIIYGKQMEAGRSQTILTIGSLCAWGCFIIFALDRMEADYNSILVVMGGMSVGVGLGMKDTIDNIVCGLSLMLGRMRPGDIVECDGVRGIVATIGYRTTSLETLDGSVISFQNSQLFAQNFRNLTRNHQYERCVVSIGVTYGTDVDRARKLILQALRRIPGLTKQHPSSVVLDNFGDSSVDLSIVVWVPVAKKVPTLSAVREAVYRTFNENGIEIPFPQQDLYIKPLPGTTVPEELKGK